MATSIATTITTGSNSLMQLSGSACATTKSSGGWGTASCMTSNYASRLQCSELRGQRMIQVCKPVVYRSRCASKVQAPLAISRDSQSNAATKFDSLPSPSSPNSPADRNFKGWMDREGRENHRLVAQLRNIAVAARDRSEMHSIIGVQRDNWNKLCHSTVTMATIAAASLAAVNGATVTPVIAMSVTAFLLNVGSSGLMFLANTFQPSQLAEEQRTAARQFHNLANEIEATLLTDPRLREDAHLYIENKTARLQALDVAFPLPLTPNGLEKFPKVVKPSVLSPEVDLSEPEMTTNNSNGWTEAVADDLKKAAQKLRNSDIEIYLGWARKKQRENKRLARLAPAFLYAAATFNIATQSLPLMNVNVVSACTMTTLAAACSMAAMFCFSFAHGGQIGMIFEMYRNCAGAYADMDNTIQRAIRMPVCQREDGELLHQKIALQLGRPNQLPLVPAEEKTAGRVF